MLASCTTQTVNNSSKRGSGQVEKNTEAAEINIQLGANYIASGDYQLADDKLQKAF